MPYARTVPALAALAVLTLAQTAQASFPAGVWALVDQVTLEPDAKDPNRVRIDGIFMVANQKPEFANYIGYSVPQRGFMYYDCDKQLATCVMEWNELLAIAGGDDRCRGWGDSSLPDNGSVRPGEAPQVEPDLYPISMGVLMGFSPCDALKAWEVENPPLPADATDSDIGSTGGSTGPQETTGAPGTTGAPSTTGTPGDESSSGAPATSDAPGTDSAPATGGPTEAGGSSGGPTTGGATVDTTDGPKLDDGSNTGCACDSTGRPDPAAALLLLAGLGLLRPRRRSA